MKKFLLILFLVITSFGLSACSKNSVSTTTQPPEATSQVEAQPEIPSEIIAKPQRLLIPTLGIDAEVEHVGLAQDGRMDVPQADMNVGWYSLGPIPGNTGSAVIAGHFDAKDGSPAVFAKLETVKPGTTIEVVTSDNKTEQFTVVDIQKYKDANFPIEKVFNPSGKPMLNLITCDGVFDQATDTYSDRLVVFAEKS